MQRHAAMDDSLAAVGHHHGHNRVKVLFPIKLLLIAVAVVKRRNQSGAVTLREVQPRNVSEHFIQLLRSDHKRIIIDRGQSIVHVHFQLVLTHAVEHFLLVEATLRDHIRAGLHHFAHTEPGHNARGMLGELVHLQIVSIFVKALSPRDDKQNLGAIEAQVMQALEHLEARLDGQICAVFCERTFLAQTIGLLMQRLGHHRTGTGGINLFHQATHDTHFAAIVDRFVQLLRREMRAEVSVRARRDVGQH